LLGSGVNVNEIHSAGAVFDYADLRFAELSNAQFRNARLRYASLLLANISDSDFCGVDLSYSDLRGTRWRHCLLDEARCGGCRMQHARLDLCHCRDMHLFGFEGASLMGVTVSRGNLFVPLPVVYQSGATEATAVVTLCRASERNGEIQLWVENHFDGARERRDGWNPVLSARPASVDDCVWTSSDGRIVNKLEPEQMNPESAPRL
jgi:hypothetical protein